MDEVKETAAAMQTEVIPLAPTHKDDMIMAVLEETVLCVNIICKALARRVNPVFFFTISHAHFIRRACAEEVRIVPTPTLVDQPRRQGVGRPLRSPLTTHLRRPVPHRRVQLLPKETSSTGREVAARHGTQLLQMEL